MIFIITIIINWPIFLSIFPPFILVLTVHKYISTPVYLRLFLNDQCQTRISPFLSSPPPHPLSPPLSCIIIIENVTQTPSQNL